MRNDGSENCVTSGLGKPGTPLSLYSVLHTPYYILRITHYWLVCKASHVAYWADGLVVAERSPTNSPKVAYRQEGVFPKDHSGQRLTRPNPIVHDRGASIHVRSYNVFDCLTFYVLHSRLPVITE